MASWIWEFNTFGLAFFYLYICAVYLASWITLEALEAVIVTPDLRAEAGTW